MSVRVRFAPSPTGFLHVGGARTALYNWLWARTNGGTFILRIEDTDAERSTGASVDQILDSMRWLGLDWDEGPYYQSQRMDLYDAALRQLIDGGWAYRAFETPEELDGMRQRAMAEGRDPIYDRRSLRLAPETVRQYLDEGRPFIWRFRCPPGKTRLPETLLAGARDATFDNEALGDFALTRSGTEEQWGRPLYNFCCAVDDADMGITHVIRGNDHLSNTSRQILVMQALGKSVPVYTHLPLIQKNGKKMSKRDADADPRFPVSVSARRDLGYLSDATVNFIALLGWAWDDKTEIFSRGELIEKFSLDKLSKSNANFDEDKYLHINALYLREMPREDLAGEARRELEAAGRDLTSCDARWLRAAVDSVAERVRLLSEIPDAMAFYFDAPAAYDAKGARKAFKGAETAGLLRGAADAVEGLAATGHDELEAALRAFAEQQGVGFGKVAQPVRLAVTGRMASPGLFDVIAIVGPQESARRMRVAADRIENEELELVDL